MQAVPPLIPSSINAKDAYISTLKVGNLTTEKIVSTGVASITTGQNQVVVPSTVVLSSSLIFLSPVTIVDTQYSSWWASNIIEENNWGQMSDDSKLEEIIGEVVSKNSKAVEDYRSGKQNSLQFLAGQVMAVTRGTAKPDKVQELLKKILN
jgi:hypothetical protein